MHQYLKCLSNHGNILQGAREAKEVLPRVGTKEWNSNPEALTKQTHFQISQVIRIRTHAHDHIFKAGRLLTAQTSPSPLAHGSSSRRTTARDAAGTAAPTGAPLSKTLLCSRAKAPTSPWRASSSEQSDCTATGDPGADGVTLGVFFPSTSRLPTQSIFILCALTEQFRALRHSSQGFSTWWLQRIDNRYRPHTPPTSAPDLEHLGAETLCKRET